MPEGNILKLTFSNCVKVSHLICGILSRAYLWGRGYFSRFPCRRLLKMVFFECGEHFQNELALMKILLRGWMEETITTFEVMGDFEFEKVFEIFTLYFLCLCRGLYNFSSFSWNGRVFVPRIRFYLKFLT